MNNLILKLHILSRAEMALLKIQLQRSSTRIMLYVVALVFALLALGMLNFAGYQALAETQTPAVAALHPGRCRLFRDYPSHRYRRRVHRYQLR